MGIKDEKKIKYYKYDNKIVIVDILALILLLDCILHKKRENNDFLLVINDVLTCLHEYIELRALVYKKYTLMALRSEF